MTPSIAPHLHFPESRLAFHPDRSSDTAITRSVAASASAAVERSGTRPGSRGDDSTCPGCRAAVHVHERAAGGPHRPRERADYLPEWPGFREVFGIQLRAAAKPCPHQVG